MSDDDPHREDVLTGRAQAIKDVIDMGNRMAAVVPTAPREEALAALLSHWMRRATVSIKPHTKRKTNSYCCALKSRAFSENQTRGA